MNARRRDNTPPFEIMGTRPGTPQAPGRGPSSAPGGFSNGLGGFFKSLTDAWHSSASEPITLRVPRGMVLAIMGALLGLLVLAYWVGYSRGGSAEAKRHTEMYQPALNGGHRLPPERTDIPAYKGQGADSDGSAQRDPRVPGNNYLILARSPRDEAARLQAFLKEREVDVMIGPGNNEELCEVIALRGFTPKAYRDTDANERFMARVRALGREWKAANQGKGDNLSSMYYQKYQPPDER